MRRADIAKVEVRLTFAPGLERAVGILAASGGRIYFEYDPTFLAQPLWLSPFKLPPQGGLLEHRDRDFGPLPGVFDDSLPDGWGLLLMDRFFRQQGIPPAEIGPLERLAFLGSRTLGALTYHPPSESADGRAPKIDLQEMAAAAAEVLRGDAGDVLPQLLRAGGSPGGARPKVLVGVRGEELLSGEGDLPEGFEAFIVKFPAEAEDRDAGRIEEAYARMAREAGIDMPPTRLFETRGGGPYFGVRRFDRQEGRRFHVHTFGNLIHANFRLPSCDYQQLFEVTRLLTRRHADLLQQFRRMVFNVLSHNRDDHAKNFAFRMNDRGEWGLSPAYDLVYSQGPGGEHTTTIAGEGKAPHRRHLIAAAADAGIDAAEAEKAIEAVSAAVSSWSTHAKDLEIGEKRRRQIQRAISSCLARLT